MPLFAVCIFTSLFVSFCCFCFVVLFVACVIAFVAFAFVTFVFVAFVFVGFISAKIVVSVVLVFAVFVGLCMSDSRAISLDISRNFMSIESMVISLTFWLKFSFSFC